MNPSPPNLLIVFVEGNVETELTNKVSVEIPSLIKVTDLVVNPKTTESLTVPAVENQTE